MKKSLINIIILALVLINLVLTVLLTFSLVSTSKKTDGFIAKIAGIIDLDLAEISTDEDGSAAATVDISNLETIEVTQSDGTSKIIISVSEDNGKIHQISVSMAISLNKKSKDYDKLKPTVESNMKLIVSEINKVVSSYSYTNILSYKPDMEEQILTVLKEKFKSDVIYSVSWTGFLVQ